MKMKFKFIAAVVCITFTAQVFASGAAPLCNGAIGHEGTSASEMSLWGLNNKKRAEVVAMQLQQSCEQQPSSDHGGYTGRFSYQWDDNSETMNTRCVFPDNFPTNIQIGFIEGAAGSFVTWRNAASNCAQILPRDEEASLVKKFASNKLN